MHSTGQNGEKMGHRLILLLVAGFVAFSSAMNELNQVQQLGLDATRLMAQWSDAVIPSEASPTLVKNETCESVKRLEQSPVSVELPWLARVAEVKEVRSQQSDSEKAARSKSTGPQFARLRQVPQVKVDPFEFEVRILTEHDADLLRLVPPDLPVTLFTTKPRKHSAPKISPRDREVFLKTLNRSINLRIAS